MKETIAILLIYLGGFVASVVFWVWLGALLIWKIFEGAGAAAIILHYGWWCTCFNIRIYCSKPLKQRIKRYNQNKKARWNGL
ncbi:hypothetical protein OGZ37_11085 [Lactococcus lactis]|uniref:hypothetical protein n=1 Tax=Lactococcus lactis TaxID=1358 RepID=UPI0024185E93|nr:hypothetical protein [Lactococcus lactis]MDG4967107.1 hypothetical protein [Lactococcus lactis]